MKRAAVPTILVVVVLLAVAVIADAQQAKKVPRIGYLSPRDRASESTRSEAIRLALRERGYIEGQNIAFEYRYADGKPDRLFGLAAELVDLKVDIIVVTGGDVTVGTAKSATKTIPIVMLGGGIDPVEAGLVKSLARPGGNVTGLTNLLVQLGGKRLELLKEAVPKLIRVAILGDPDQRNYPVQMTDLKAAAQALHLELHPVRLQKADDMENAFSTMTNANVRAFFLVVNPAFGVFRNKILELATKNRLPGMYSTQDYVNAGGLMTYAADRIATARRLAVYVDKVLKVTKPTDLPVERPTKFEFVINLKAAKQIGLTIPPNVLARADKVLK
jgi:putative ABC transport system substrate-binding protein